MKTYKVDAGDDLEKIALEHGVAANVIWDLDENEELRHERRDPGVLKEGDEIVIPDVDRQEVLVETGERHTFVRKPEPPLLRIVVIDNDEPVANAPFTLELETAEGEALPEISSETDDHGLLEEPIPAQAAGGELIVFPGEHEVRMPIRLGELDPVEEGPRGAQAMLNNMGYQCGNEDDGFGPKTRLAVQAFQEDNYLELLPDDAAEIDDLTLEAIKQAYIWVADERDDESEELIDPDVLEEVEGEIKEMQEKEIGETL